MESAAPKPPRIAVFFTLGNSLESWEAAGILDRELAIYRELAKDGIGIVLVTYGTGDESARIRTEQGMEVVANHWRAPHRLYEWFLPLLHARVLRGCDVFKTNQTNGAHVALRAARLLQKPLMARCGYMWSDFAARQYGEGSGEQRRAERVERRVFPAARVVVVTTQAMSRDVQKRLGVAAAKCRVIPNYVDTDRFRPVPARREPNRVVFVGRLASQKNVEPLLESVRSLALSATIVGSGPDRERLMETYGVSGIDWIERVAHIDLPEVINSGSIFVLPSLYEGHPKTLLEAMACGLPVIGTDVPGIREIIRNGDTGLLCEPRTQAIRSALVRVLEDPALAARLGDRARQYIVENFSLKRVAEWERRLIREMAA